jgi:GR25 family glycosyltransferase involved in LPS biosynthesis
VNRTPIFVITLEHRKDRQDAATTSLNQAGIRFQFSVSSRGEQLENFEAMQKASQIEVAIWGAHVKALKSMLETESKWALILEDDFIIQELGFDLLKNQNAIDRILESVSPYYSILQIGYLENSIRGKTLTFIACTFRFFFRFNRFDLRSYLNHFRFLGFKDGNYLNRILEQNGLRKTKVLFGLRLATHAYFINREAAAVIIDVFEKRFSNPKFMPIDQYLLSMTKNFEDAPLLRAARLSELFVKQGGSPSDNLGQTEVSVLKSR